MSKRLGLEIPVSDFQRAKKFYSAVWNYEIEEEKIGEKLIGFFPYDSSIGVKCAIVREDTILSGRTKNDPVYLDCPQDIDIIIARVEKADKSKRDSNSIPTQFIKECPECSTKLERPEGDAVFRCPNSTGCPPQIKGSIEHFIGRKAMDVSSLGEGKIDVLYQSGLVHRPVDLYDLKYDNLLGLSKSIVNEDSAEERVVSFKEKTVQNILDGIQASKSQPFERVLFALGIRFVGETVAKKLAYHFKNVDALINASIEDLNATPEIGDVIAQSVISYFSSDENKTEIEQMKSHGLIFNVEEKELSSNKLENLRFVVSGVFSLFSRMELKKIIEENGGKNVSSISKSTDFLVVGDNMGPAKKEKAEKLGIKMIDENEFSSMISE